MKTHPKVTYRYSRLTFHRDSIEPLKDSDRFRAETSLEAFEMSKAEFYQTFPKVVQTDSYTKKGLYNYPKVPEKAKRFLVTAGHDVPFDPQSLELEIPPASLEEVPGQRMGLERDLRTDLPDIRCEDAITLSRIAVHYCRLPNPHVVQQLRGAVFPVVRDSGKRMKIGMENGRRVMYDDNTTPRWALLWSHGCGKTGQYPEGWTFAHVWNESKDPDAYTHVANLVMMPECFASLSDKLGPLVPLLRHHAAAVYGWWPVGKDDSVGTPPPGYDGLKWNYLDAYADPRGFIQNQLRRLNSQRVKSLRDLLLGSR